MKIIKIGNVVYRIKRIKRLIDGGDVLFGQINYKKSTIKLTKRMSNQHERQTIWHEAIHAIAHQTGAKIDEQLVEILASGIMQVINDNPEIGKKVTDGPTD